MIFDESPLRTEADEIVYTEDTSGAYAWTLEFKLQEESPVDLGDEDIAQIEREKDGFFKPFKLTNIDFVEDYEKAAYEYVTCSMTLGAGMWSKVILPSRKHLLAHLKREKMDHVTGAIDKEVEPDTFVYKVILKVNEEQNSDTQSSSALTRRELDVRGFIDLDIELVDRAREQVRQKSVGGIWRQATSKEVIEAIYHKGISDIEVEGEPAFDGVEFAKGYAEEKREHFLIPQGTPLLDVGHFINRAITGVWPTGFNSFIKDRIWYVYPLFDTTRFDEEKKTLTVVRVPQGRYKSPDNTYKEDSGRIKIIATSSSNLLDATHHRYLRDGDGVRFADASKMVEGWMETKDNKAIAHRSKRNTEIKIEDKTNIDHFTKLADERQVDNPLVQYSALAARKGQILTFLWENANHLLLRPGMMCKILYLSGDDVRELNGVLMMAHSSVQLFGHGPTANSYRNTCALFIYCNISAEETEGES